jgi:hypothetical protein
MSIEAHYLCSNVKGCSLRSESSADLIQTLITPIRLATNKCSGNRDMIVRFIKKDLWASLKITYGFVFKSFQKSIDACRELFFSDDLPRQDLERWLSQGYNSGEVQGNHILRTSATGLSRPINQAGWKDRNYAIKRRINLLKWSKNWKLFNFLFCCYQYMQIQYSYNSAPANLLLLIYFFQVLETTCCLFTGSPHWPVRRQQAGVVWKSSLHCGAIGFSCSQKVDPHVRQYSSVFVVSMLYFISAL